MEINLPGVKNVPYLLHTVTLAEKVAILSLLYDNYIALLRRARHRGWITL